MSCLTPTEVEKSILALTTAIHLVQLQSTVTDTPVYIKQGDNQSRSRAYNHIATLLTQGPGHQVVAVTGKSGSCGLSIIALQEVEDVDQLPDVDSGDGVRLGVQTIKPNNTTLEDLADPSKDLPTQQVPLHEHASDVFRALIELSKHRNKHLPQFMQFVWLRCHRKIKERIAVDEMMLGMPIHQLLEDWQPTDTDLTIPDVRLRVHRRLYPQFDLLEIPFLFHEDTRTRLYLFSGSTIPRWCDLFIRTLKTIKALVAESDMQSAQIFKLSQQFAILDLLLYGNLAFELILSRPSLRGRVQDLMKIQEQKRRTEWPEKLNDIALPDDCFDPDDSSGSSIVRCCKGVIAWFRAGTALSRSKFFQGPSLNFHLISSFHPTQNNSVANLQELMLNVILPKLKPLPVDVDKTALIQQLINCEYFIDEKKFSGKIHCEATLMTLIHSFPSTTPPKSFLPFSKKQVQELGLLLSVEHLISKIEALLIFALQDVDQVVGVGRKSCSCCYSLARLLCDHATWASSSTELASRAYTSLVFATSSFHIPGTHSIVHPWTPPFFGIPEGVSERLKEMLIDKLTEVTNNWMESQIVRHPIQQSSPESVTPSKW